MFFLKIFWLWSPYMWGACYSLEYVPPGVKCPEECRTNRLRDKGLGSNPWSYSLGFDLIQRAAVGEFVQAILCCVAL